jgi:predicted nuclease of predicted toxin-antitoxin system
VKFLTDECLSPELTLLARARGFQQSTHVTWLGLSGAKDHVIARRAVDESFIFVTHNTADFRPLYAKKRIHLGLVGFNTAARIMNLVFPKALFLRVLRELDGAEPYNEALEISVAADGIVVIDRYRLPPA